MKEFGRRYTVNLVLDKHEELLLARVLDPNILLSSSGDGRMIPSAAPCEEKEFRNRFL